MCTILIGLSTRLWKATINGLEHWASNLSGFVGKIEA